MHFAVRKSAFSMDVHNAMHWRCLQLYVHMHVQCGTYPLTNNTCKRLSSLQSSIMSHMPMCMKVAYPSIMQAVFYICWWHAFCNIFLWFILELVVSLCPFCTNVCRFVCISFCLFLFIWIFISPKRQQTGNTIRQYKGWHNTKREVQKLQ